MDGSTRAKSIRSPFVRFRQVKLHVLTTPSTDQRRCSAVARVRTGQSLALRKTWRPPRTAMAPESAMHWQVSEMPGLFLRRFHAPDALIFIRGDFVAQIPLHMVIQD